MLRITEICAIILPGKNSKSSKIKIVSFLNYGKCPRTCRGVITMGDMKDGSPADSIFNNNILCKYTENIISNYNKNA